VGCQCKQIFGDKFDLVPACIGSVWIFEDLRPEERQALAASAVRKVYRGGEVIFSQGEKADQMFLIKAGRVKLSKLTRDGGEIILDLRKGGDFIGENILHEEIDYPLSATCLADTLTCGFTKRIFEKLVLDYPSIGLQVIKNLSKRMAVLSDRVESISLTTIAEKLYRSLLLVASEYGKKESKGFVIDLPFTHEELSFLVGVHRVSITRAMKELRRAGRIIQDKKKITLVGELN
jgi:CRP/FNR family cyclic AMP-dependent transcriptional regulator